MKFLREPIDIYLSESRIEHYMLGRQCKEADVDDSSQRQLVHTTLFYTAF